MPVPRIEELTLADRPAAWEELGFALDGEICRLGEVRVRLSGAGLGQGGIVGWSLRDLHSAELDGLPTTLWEGAPAEPAPEHPNGVLAIDHVVAVSPAFERSLAALRAAGLDLRRVREEPTPAGAPRQAFFRLGAEILELVEEPAQVVARAGGADRPARFWGLALLAPTSIARSRRSASGPVRSVRRCSLAGGSRQSGARRAWRWRWR